MILDSKFQLPYQVTNKEIQIFNLSKSKPYYSVRIQLLWTQKQFNWKITSLPKPVKRSVALSSLTRLIQIKESLEIIMKIESQLFWIFLSPRTRLILILSGHKSAFLEYLMVMVVLLVPITWGIIFITLWFKMNSSHRIQLKLSEKASRNVKETSYR